MPVNRHTQIIVSPFGPRAWPPGFHRGVDLRTVIREPFKQLFIVAPENIKIIKIGWQDKWGGNIIARGLDSGYKLKFIHVKEADGLAEGKTVETGTIIARPVTTDYMKERNFWQHLHFETWGPVKPFDPVKYFDERGIKYEYK